VPGATLRRLRARLGLFGRPHLRNALTEMLGIALELVTSNSLTELLAMLDHGRVDVLTSL
jgi:hypothetical protein